MFSYNLILGRLRRFWQVQSGLANLANQRLIAHAHQMFPRAKVAVKAFTTGGMPIVSLSPTRRCHRAHPAPSRAMARGGASIPAPTPPREATLDPWLEKALLRLRHRTGRGVPELSLSIEVDLLIAKTYVRRRPSLHRSQQMLSDPTRMRLSMTTEA